MNTKHTPGPLTLGAGGMVGKKEQRLFRPICTVCQQGENFEWQPNARLLAAAYNSYDKHCGPRAVECAEADLLDDLLETCSNLTALVRDLCDDIPEETWARIEDDVNEQLEKADAALAKAERRD